MVHGMAFRRRQREFALARPMPDTRASVATLSELARELAKRDRPLYEQAKNRRRPSAVWSLGNIYLPALHQIAFTTAEEMEKLGESRDPGIRVTLATSAKKAAGAASADARYSERLRAATRAQAAQHSARNRLLAAHPEREFDGSRTKLLVAGVYITLGGLTEILLAYPVANSMGMQGIERALTQIALGTLLTLGSIFGGWLASYANHASRWQRIVISGVAASLIAALLLVQARLAPIRGDIIAAQLKLLTQHHKALKALTVSRSLTTQLFQNLGRVVVGLGATEGYVLHDPLTGAYRRASRAAAKSLADAAEYRTIAIERNIDSTITAASFGPYQASWLAAARSLQAAARRP